MRILITGARGQLGTALQDKFKEHELFLADLPEMDLTCYSVVRDYFLEIRPELVFHCAAKTQVDDCELKPAEAYTANVLATKYVVNGCQETGAELVYVSTDYVFDGTATEPYREYDRCNPQSVYGKTKWQGEEIVRTHLDRFYIARTAWLFGDTGQNFVRTMLKLAGERDCLRVVHDQRGCPTYASDLAEALVRLVQTGSYGIYHVTNDGDCTWFEFTREILKAAGKEGVKVEPITTSEINRPAPRPAYSIMARDALNGLGIIMPPYQEALRRFISQLA